MPCVTFSTCNVCQFPPPLLSIPPTPSVTSPYPQYVTSHTPTFRRFLYLHLSRRLELFGEEHNIRDGWVTVGRQLPTSNFRPDVYAGHFRVGHTFGGVRSHFGRGAVALRGECSHTSELTGSGSTVMYSTGLFENQNTLRGGGSHFSGGILVRNFSEEFGWRQELYETGWASFRLTRAWGCHWPGAGSHTCCLWVCLRFGTFTHPRMCL